MKKILISIFCFAALSLFAQNTPITKANYDLAARFSPEKVNKMVFSTTVSPNWLKHSNRFWYEYSTPEGKKFYIVDANTGVRRELFDPVQISADVMLVVKDPFDAKYLPVQDLKFIDNETKIRFGIKSSLDEDKKEPTEGDSQDNRRGGNSTKKEKKIFWFEYDLQSKKLTELQDFDPEKKYPTWANISPDGETVLFMKHYELYWMDKENFEKARKNDKDTTIVEHKITDDGEEHFAWGSVTRGETNVDRKKNKDSRYPVYAVWSPDSKHFAIIRGDEREVDELWVINSIAEPRPTLETYKYHMAGEPNAAKYYLYLFENAGKTSKMVDVWAFKDQTIEFFRKPILQKDRNNDYNSALWLGYNDKFYINRTSRDLKRIDICEIDVSTAIAKPIIEERLNTYVELRPLRLIESTGELIHWSERTGWGHWYLYDSKGNLKNAITSSDFHCESIAGINPRTRTLFFNAMGREANENPYYQHLYSVKLDGSGLKLLNKGDFFHTVSMNDECTHFVNNYSRVNTVPKSDLMDINGRVITNLETTDLSRLFAAGYKFPEPFTVKASDGITDLYGVMYKPFDFDSTKLYPLVQYVYPGPQTEAIEFAFTSRRMDRTDRLAQMGMIVVSIGNLGGSPHRGKRYHNHGYGDLRDYGLKCKITAAQQLAARHDYIDINKVGITGFSGGGFMSTAAILKYPDFFKVAVSNCGNHDNNIYNRWWSEKHHGILEEIVQDKKDTTGTKFDTIFKYNMPTNQSLAKNLKGKLLLTTGEIDNNVHPAATMRVAHALIKANKRFDMFIYPTMRHSYSNNDMTEYYFWQMADYFSEHLIGDSEMKQTDIRQMNF